jgi:hypothetical protein
VDPVITDRHRGSGCPHGELAVGWSLHTLEPAEEMLVEAHLPDCVECSRLVAETEQVGAVLGLSVPLATPSTALEQRVLAFAATVAQVPPAPPPAPSTVPAPQPESQPTGRSPGTGTPRSPGTRPPAARPRRRPRPRPGRQPICIPDTLKLILVALLVLGVAAVIVFYAVP